MGSRKMIAAIILACSAMLAVTSANSIEFFSANRYDELAALPGSSLGAPSGLVSGWGSAFVAFGGLANTSSSDKTDGNLAAGIGLGDPIYGIGSVVSLNVGSVSPKDGFGERGSLSASAGKFFVGHQLGVAVGAINIVSWNDLTIKPKYSAYVALTKIIPIVDHPIIINAGVGNNAYADVREEDPENVIGGFVSAAVYLTPHISFIADYTSNILTFGGSILPVSDFPLIFTLGLFDVNERTPGSDGATLVGSIAYSFMF